MATADDNPFVLNPEGATLAALRRKIPNIVDIATRGCEFLRQSGFSATLVLSELSRTDVYHLAMYYNNLHVYYNWRHTARNVRTRRFVQRVCTQDTAHLCCDRHQQCALCEHHTHESLSYSNEFSLSEDLLHVPRDQTLAIVMQAFERSVHFNNTYRLCELLGVGSGGGGGSSSSTNTNVRIINRLFVNVYHYMHVHDAAVSTLAVRREQCARQAHCVNCCPCTATLLFERYPPGATLPVLLPSVDADATDTSKTTTMPLPIRTQLLRMPVNPLAGVMESAYFRRRTLLERHNALLWFFGGVTDPLRVFFEVVQSLENGDLQQRVEVVQDVAMHTYVHLVPYFAEQAELVHATHILPALHAKPPCLYAHHLKMISTDCTLLSCNMGEVLTRQAQNGRGTGALRGTLTE